MIETTFLILFLTKDRHERAIQFIVETLSLVFHAVYWAGFQGSRICAPLTFFLPVTEIIQVNNYEIIIKNFHISHNLTWYSAIVHKFTRIYPVNSTYELTKQFM